jgi:hypothetical protein
MSTVMELANGQDETTAQGESPDLFKQMFLKIVFGTHIWEGKRVIDGTEVTARDGEKIESDRADPSPVRLAPKSWLKKGTKWRSQVYKTFNESTLPADTPGARLLAVEESDEFVARLQMVIDEGKKLGEEFAAAVPEFVQWNWDFWRKKYASDEEYREEVGKHIPSAAELRDQFTVTYQLIEPDDALKCKYVNAATRKFIVECRQNAIDSLEQLKEDVVKKPIEALVAASAQFENRLKTGQRIDDRAFADMESALRLCITFGTDLDTKAVLRKFQDQVSKVVTKAKKAKNDKSKDGGATAVVKAHKVSLLAAMQTVIGAVQDATKQQEALARFGHMPRALDFSVDLGEDD